MKRLAIFTTNAVLRRFEENVLAIAATIWLDLPGQRRGPEGDREKRTNNPPIAQRPRTGEQAAGEKLDQDVPHTDATGRQTPRTPETRPRWTDGTWSGITPPRRRAAR